VRVVLEDGSELPTPGQAAVSDLTVDATSGQITLRAEVPNPDGMLLPGQYVRVRLSQAELPSRHAAAAAGGHPHQPGRHRAGGRRRRQARPAPGEGGQRPEQPVGGAGRPKAGEQVIVDGFQKMMVPGAPVKPVPWTPGAGPHRASLPVLPRAGAAAAPSAGCGQQIRGRTMAQFFINRPIFAWVIALFIMVMGGVAITQLPVSQYPPVAPPSIVISAGYPGASAQTLEDSVLSVIEREMNGSPGMIYMESVAQANGTGSIT
jgi:hypothetical protein